MQLPRTPARQLTGGELDGGCEVVQLHGNLALLRCSICRATCGWEEQDREAHFQSGEAPSCPSCEVLAQDRRDRGKRGTAVGFLRPNIVLYGEDHPSADSIGKLSVHDLSLAPDLLLILGTSLQVHGLKLLVKEFAKSVHARGRGKGKVIFVNLSKPSESVWKNVIDYWVSMDCDEWVDAMRVHRPGLWHMQTQLDAQISKPQPHMTKRKTDSKEIMSETGERRDSSEIFQDDVLEPKGVAGTIVFLGSGLKSEPSVNQATIREPLQKISNEVLNYSLRAPPVADLAKVRLGRKGTSKPNENPNLPGQGPTEPKTNRQLVKPPSSGDRSRSQDSSRKRCRADEAYVPPIPAKRSKMNTQIWQDRDGLIEVDEMKRQEQRGS
jgi:hypothetical protein